MQSSLSPYNARDIFILACIRCQISSWKINWQESKMFFYHFSAQGSTWIWSFLSLIGRKKVKKSQYHSYQGATQQLWSQESMCVNLPGRDGIKLVWFVFLRIFWAVSLSGAREEKQKFLVWHGVQSKDLQCGPSHVHQQCSEWWSSHHCRAMGCHSHLHAALPVGSPMTVLTAWIHRIKES